MINNNLNYLAELSLQVPHGCSCFCAKLACMHGNLTTNMQCKAWPELVSQYGCSDLTDIV